MKQNEECPGVPFGRTGFHNLPLLGIETFYTRRSGCASLTDRNMRSKVEVARRIAEKAGVAFSLLDLSLLGQMTHNALTDASVVMDKEKPADALPNTFVPGRNMLFLTLAAVKAYEKGIRNLVTGVSQTDFSGYPDCRDTFIRSLNVSLNLGHGEPVCDTHAAHVARQGAGVGAGR